MAGTSPPYGVGSHYLDTSSLTEDVTDFIYQITPEDTPFFHLCGDAPASVSHPWHQWQKRALTTRQVNANIEGFGYTFTSAMVLPTREGNVLQILNQDIRVSRTAQEIGHYAISDLMADQTEVKLVQLKTDIEHALLRATLNTGGTATARQMIGIIPLVMTTLSGYTNGSQVTFTESRFNGMFEQGWALGADYKDVLVGGTLKRIISNFTGNGFRAINTTEAKIVNTITTYESDFGTVQIHLSRDVNTVTDGAGGSLGRCALFIDKTHLKKAWLHPVSVDQAAKTADSRDAIAVCEMTLEWGHPAAHGLMRNFTGSV